MQRIHVLQGDITKCEVDVIVNAANSSLLGGGGVDGAIHRAAGPELLEVCRTLRGCKVGEAKITPGFRLPAKYVIHTVGPIWRGGNNQEAEKLRSCYEQSLRLATEHQLTSIAFPAISCGVYRFPITQATEIAVETVQAYLNNKDTQLQVHFVCFEHNVYEAYTRKLGG